MAKDTGAASVGSASRSIWSRHYTSAFVVGVLLVGYSSALARPMLARIGQLQGEVMRLEAEQTTPLADRHHAKSEVESRTTETDSFNARDLLPRISMLARRSRLKVRTLKQSSAAEAAREREVRIVAQGAFPAVVGFLDDVARALPQGRFEEISLRQHSNATEIELESVLRTHVEEPAAIVDGGDEGSS